MLLPNMLSITASFVLRRWLVSSQVLGAVRFLKIALGIHVNLEMQYTKRH